MSSTGRTLQTTPLLPWRPAILSPCWVADDALVAVTTGDLVALLDLAALRDEDADELVDTRREVVAGLAGEADDVDDAAVGAVRHLEGGVAHVVGLGTEDGAEQALLGREGRLALGRDLADEDVAGADL